MKTLVKIFGIVALFFLAVNCNTSKTVVTESNIEAVEPTPPAPQKVEQNTTSETPIFGTQEIQKKRTPSAAIISTKQGQ
jgi:hypothetical protein